MSYGDVCKTEAGLAEIRRAEERELLIKSGAGRAEVEEAMKTVETAKRGAGAGLPVRVVRTEVVISDAIGHSFSACRADERLIGGSCGRTRGKGSAPLFQDAENGPTHYGDDDTVAARWRCNGMRGDTVVAKALCQRLPSP